MVTRGRAVSARPELGPIRSLAREDLALLAVRRDPVNIIQKLRDPHHRLARMLATGMRQVEVAALCGMSYNRLHVLTKDPAFQELVASYRGLVTAEFVRSQDHFMEVATSNMLKAETMLAEKLEAAEENGEFLPTRDLIAISRDAADRFGYGKKSLNVNVNVDFAAKLEEARKRSAAVDASRSTPLRVIEGSAPPQSATVANPAPSVSTPQSLPSNRPGILRRI
jgi:hypothetical protein